MPDQPHLLTLSEVSKRTKISMPTLQRYKKEYQRRIPSVGKNHKQRYPVEALEVFQAIKQENLAKRGRRKGAVKRTRRVRQTAGVKAPRRRRGASDGRKPGSLLTLKEIERRTGISYPTLLRYVSLHGARIPHEGRGRKRRYHPEGVDVFKELRAQSRRGGGTPVRGRRPGVTAAGSDGSLARRLTALEKSQAGLERQIRNLMRQLRKPVTVTLGRGR